MRSTRARSGEQLCFVRCAAGFAGVGFCRQSPAQAWVGEQARVAVSSCGVRVVQHFQGECKAGSANST